MNFNKLFKKNNVKPISLKKTAKFDNISKLFHLKWYINRIVYNIEVMNNGYYNKKNTDNIQYPIFNNLTKQST